MPFYTVKQEGQKARIVEADNPSAALRHVAQSTFTVSKPLKAADIVPLMRDGAVVETAGAAPEQDTESEPGAVEADTGQ